MTARRGKLAQGLFAAGTVALLIVLSFGIRAWLTRTRDVPDEVMSKLHWELRDGSVDDVGPIYIDLYNGSDWTIKQVVVELTAGREKRKYRAWSEAPLSPLSNSAIGFCPDDPFRKRWMVGGASFAELAAHIGKDPKWRVVNVTGRPGG